MGPVLCLSERELTRVRGRLVELARDMCESFRRKDQRQWADRDSVILIGDLGTGGRNPFVGPPTVRGGVRSQAPLVYPTNLATLGGSLCASSALTRRRDGSRS